MPDQYKYITTQMGGQYGEILHDWCRYFQDPKVKGNPTQECKYLTTLPS